MAVGAALPGAAPLACDIAIEGIPVCSAGTAIDYDEAALARAIDRREVEYEITLAGDGRRNRGLLLRPLARVRTDQRGVHNMCPALH